MKNTFLYLLVNILFAYSTFAQIKFTGKITDADTGEEIVFAHVFIKDHSGTVSNVDGEFIISIKSLPQTLVISHLAYETKTVRLNEAEVGALNISLKIKATQLEEVFISPYNTQEVITNAIKKGLKGINNKIKSELFYRQITKTDEKPTEMVEAFYNGVTSIAGLENMKIVNGRFAKLPSDKKDSYPSLGNFYYLSTIPIIQQTINDIILPMNEDFDDFYYYKIKRILDSENGSDIAEVNFRAKSVEKTILEGNVYIDLETSNIVKLKGQINDNMGIKFENNKIYVDNTIFSVDMLFDYQNVEMPTLRSVKTDISFDMVQGDIIKKVNVTSMMFAYARNGAANKNAKRMSNESNLLKEIRKTKYKKKYWKDNPVIKRTLSEQSIIKSFEESDLFKYKSN